MIKVAFLSSYTNDFVVDQAKQLLKQQGLVIDTYLSPFGQYTLDILDPSSRLKDFDPEIIVFSIDAETVLADEQEFINLLQNAHKQFDKATLLVHNLVPFAADPLALMEWNDAGSKRQKIAQINQKIAELAQSHSRLRVLDLQRLAERHGLDNLLDRRFFLIAKAPFSNWGNKKIAEQLSSAIAAVSGKRAKCLILDLDNVLWGGIIGEDGFDRIELNNDGQGKAWFDFQKVILKLHQSGIMLAICSKNNEDEALAVIDQHPSMVLRLDNFSARRINWQNKATNLQELAGELNLGLDSFVFLDDSPYEREYVRSILPQVQVPDLPNDPANYADFLARLPYFETFQVTTEDHQRGVLYKQEQERKQIEKTSKSHLDFLHCLKTTVRVKPINNFNLPRASQLTQRTNQFNLTTKRYSEAELLNLSKQQDWRILVLSASDRLGDLGIVAIAMVKLANGVAVLDSFLVSCRVLGRGIEQAFLALVLKTAKESDANSLQAQFIASEKNTVAKTF